MIKEGFKIYLHEFLKCSAHCGIEIPLFMAEFCEISFLFTKFCAQYRCFMVKERKFAKLNPKYVGNKRNFARKIN